MRECKRKNFGKNTSRVLIVKTCCRIEFVSLGYLHPKKKAVFMRVYDCLS